MRFMNYLTEMSETALAQYIRDNCGQWFNESRGYMMRGHIAYRGIVSSPKDGDILVPHTNRRPKDTDIQDQIRFDDALEKKFGWRPRQEGTFCTGDYKMASMYGDTYAIFPLDGYKYIWSTKVQDFYSEFYSAGGMEKYLNSWNDLVSMFVKDEVVGDYIKDTVINKMVKTYKNTDLAKAIESENEIIVKCKGYVVVSIDTMRKLAL